MLLEAKDGEAAVAFPVSFSNYEGHVLFAPLVKNGEMLGFAGAGAGGAAESLTLSGIFKPCACTLSCPRVLICPLSLPQEWRFLFRI